MQLICAHQCDQSTVDTIMINAICTLMIVRIYTIYIPALMIDPQICTTMIDPISIPLPSQFIINTIVTHQHIMKHMQSTHHRSSIDPQIANSIYDCAIHASLYSMIWWMYV